MTEYKVPDMCEHCLIRKWEVCTEEGALCGICAEELGVYSNEERDVVMSKLNKIMVWITKHALTSGILCVEAEMVNEGMVAYRHNGYTDYAHGNEFQVSLGAAMERAEEMRQTKIKNLKKQLVKLEKMVIVVKEEVKEP